MATTTDKAQVVTGAEKAEIRIPQITDRELKTLYARIKPVVRGSQLDDGELAEFIGRWTEENKAGRSETAALKKAAPKSLFWIKEVDPENIAFTWEPKAAGVASGLKKIGSIITYHTYGYYGCFKPSIKEVLAQIPKELLAKVCAFETVMYSDDINGLLTPDQEYHKGKTTLYAMEEGGIKKLLRGEERNWSARSVALKKAAKLKKQNAEIDAASEEVMKCIHEATISWSNDQISSYSFGIRSGFRTLLKYLMYDRTEDNALYTLLGTLNKEFASGSLGVLKAGLVLEELGSVLNQDHSGYLAQEENNGLNDHAPLNPWEREVVKLAKSVLMRVHESFDAGRMESYTAKRLVREAKPFILENPADQLLLMGVMIPILKRVAKDYHYDSKDLENVLQLLRKGAVE